MKRLRDWMRASRRLPLSALWVRAARKLARGAADVGSLQVFTWLTAETPPPDPASAFVGREVGVGEIEAVARALGKDPAAFAERMRAGDRCFAAFAGEVPVHARWVATRPTHVPEIDRYFVPGPGEAYVYDSYTAPRWRGKRATDVARRVMDRTLHAEGITRGWNYVLSDNHPSLRALSKTQRRAFRIPYLRLRRTCLVFLRGSSPPLSIA